MNDETFLELFKTKKKDIKMKIAVAGTGYVGLSIATLLAQHHEIIAVDIIEEKVNMINQRKSPIQDNEIEDFFNSKKLNLTAEYSGVTEPC